MRDLIITGTGVHALEMAEIVERVNKAGKIWRLLGYIHLEGESPAAPELNGYKVLGGPETVSRYPDAHFVPSYSSRIDQVPYDRWATVIDPSVFVSRTAKIGAGCVIFPNCYIGYNAKIGDFVFCLSGAVINHDDVIGNNSTITSGVAIAGEVTIGEGCYIGQKCTVRQLLTIGDGCIIGTGAVVVKDVPSNSVMVGNPARLLRYNNDDCI